MESGAIKDGQISASSKYNNNYGGEKARLWNKGMWLTHILDKNPWLQIDLGGQTKVTAVATQGRISLSHWVSKYKLQYSNDGRTFNYYMEEGREKVKYPSTHKRYFFYRRPSTEVQAASVKLSRLQQTANGSRDYVTTISPHLPLKGTLSRTCSITWNS